MFKKVVLILLVLVIFGRETIFAQHAGQWSVGGRAGVLFGNHDYEFDLPVGSSYIDDKSKINFNFSIYGAYTIIDRLSIQTELNFMINQGYKYECSLGGSNIEATLSYSSLDIPILLKYAFLNKSLVFGIMVGPHITIPISDFKIEATGSLPVKADIEGVNFGLNAGLFAGYPVGPGRIVGDLRLINDFKELEAKAAGVTREVMKRRGISITLGYEIFF